jgi:predicted transcriptional regulator
MYGANLSYDQLNEYLNFLLENGLISKETDVEYEGAVVYKVAQKGRQFLERYSQLQDILAHSQQGQTAPTNYFDLPAIRE